MLLSSKYDELDDEIPMIRDMQKLTKFEYSYREIEEEEARIVKMFDWELNILTPLNFLESLIGLGLVFADDRIEGSIIACPLTSVNYSCI